MRLDDLGEALNTVRPDADGLISRARDDLVSVGSHADTMNCAFVSHEAEGAHHRFKVPDHDGAVEGTRNDLTQVRIEA